ncbi:MAG: MlaD family protein [Paludibacteraceae bacterium]|jgi:phospholipid/cholesterol/gamma-HCH transport system substrate-binding protein|nr:MlaD family protein [Paludibacteraceae bacterium]MEE1174210.1 MlaD family protein [Paludibacteraceae bacterium]
MKKFTFSREAKIGVAVAIAIGMLYFGLNFLKGVNIFQPTTYFYAQYERVDGIVPTTPVMINGYQVGHVSQINFDYTKEAPITLQITVDNKLVVPQGTIAEIYDTGLMGDKAIQLKLGRSNTLLQPGDTLRTSVQNGLMAAVTDALVEPIKAMMPQLDSTIKTINHTLSGERVQSLLTNAEAAIANFKAISANLKKELPTTMSNVNNITANLSEVSDELKAAQLDSTLLKVDATIANLENITNQLKSNENTLGALLNDKELYQNLDSTVQSANALLIDLKENPKRYVHFSVFGSKEKKESESTK